MHLNNRARELLDKYSAGMAQQFGARDTSRYFALNDPQENALRLALLESVEFLNMITCLDVDQLSGGDFRRVVGTAYRPQRKWALYPSGRRGR